MPELDPTDPGCPLFYETMNAFGPRFHACPWAPELLVLPDPSTITGQVDLLRRRMANTGDTQLMEVISCEP